MDEVRSFMLWPDGRVEELVDEDGTVDSWHVPELYTRLVFAGFPIYRDPFIGAWDSILDVRVHGGRVAAFTAGREHDMGPAGEVFLAWFRQYAEGLH